MNEPLTAELVSIKLTPQEYKTLMSEGQVTSDLDRIDGYLRDNGLVLEIPQGPAFINGQWT
tara:strand:+ start:202 stop:384 length:183 start_codon:yes stop_codon:yes gene_type:complete